MKKGLIIGGVIVGGLLLIALMFGGWFMGIYNSVQTQNQNVETAQSAVQVEYQRRFDLVPNLVAATKGYMAQETRVFESIAEARTRYASAEPNSTEQVEATNQYESALARLLVVMENYPVLQSISVVKDLTANLEGTENRIQIARDRYNEQVRVYNMNIVTFPRSVVAGMFGFKTKPYYEANAGAQEAPKVDLTI